MKVIDETIDLTLYSIFNPDINRKWAPAHNYKKELLQNNPLFSKKKSFRNMFDRFFSFCHLLGAEDTKISSSLKALDRNIIREKFIDDCNLTLLKVFNFRNSSLTKITDEELLWESNKNRIVSEQEEYHYYEKTIDNPGLYSQVYDDTEFYDAIFKRNYIFKMNNLYTKIKSINDEIIKFNR
jgi:hypothetical protein